MQHFARENIGHSFSLRDKVSVVRYNNSKISDLEAKVMELQSREEGLEKELQYCRANAESASAASKSLIFERDSALQRVEIKEEAYEGLKFQFNDALKRNREVDDMLDQTRRVIHVLF